MTGVGGVAIVLTGGRGYYSRLVAVAERINLFCIGVTAVAGVSFNALVYTVRSSCYNTLVIIVTECVNLVGYITVATMTGICCITINLTSRRSNYRLVRVTESINLFSI